MTKTLGRGPTRSERMLIILAVVALFASLVTIYMPTPAQADSHTPNQAGYWEDLYPEASECIKYGATGSNQHGSSDGTAVTLNSGFEFVVLIVKGGSVDHGYGSGNAVYENPVAGTAYSAPANAGGQSAEVSHWIICVGEEEPDEASVDVRGECVEEDFVITISAHNATVDIDLDGDGVLESGEMGLGSGDYEFTGDDENWIPWEATATDGAEFDDGKTTTSGEIYIEECEEDLIASVDIGGVCVDEMFYVTVSSENATVSVDLDGDGVFGAGETDLADGNHKVTADPGDEIDWIAVADEDAEFDEDIDELEGEIEVEDCEEPEVRASIVVTVSGTCVLDEGVGQGVITVTIPIDGGATVVITDEGDNEIATLTESGTVNVPEGATYSWEAEANEGFEFPPDFVESGDIEIVECSEPEVQASVMVTVTGACFVVSSDGQGRITVDMSVDGAATVVITDDEDNVVATVTKPSTIIVDEGATYSWEAEANEGFEFPVGFNPEGDVVIATCSQPEELPFTGIDSEPLVAIAATLLGLGSVLVISTRRREEF